MQHNLSIIVPLRRSRQSARGSARWFGQRPQLLLHLLQNARRQDSEASYEPPVVDRSALVDHDLAVVPVAGHALRERDTEQVRSREARSAGQDPD